MNMEFYWGILYIRIKKWTLVQNMANIIQARSVNMKKNCYSNNYWNMLVQCISPVDIPCPGFPASRGCPVGAPAPLQSVSLLTWQYCWRTTLRKKLLTTKRSINGSKSPHFFTKWYKKNITMHCHTHTDVPASTPGPWPGGSFLATPGILGPRHTGDRRTKSISPPPSFLEFP